MKFLAEANVLSEGANQHRILVCSNGCGVMSKDLAITASVLVEPLSWRGARPEPAHTNQRSTFVGALKGARTRRVNRVIALTTTATS